MFVWQLLFSSNIHFLERRLSAREIHRRFLVAPFFLLPIFVPPLLLSNWMADAVKALEGSERYHTQTDVQLNV